MSTRKNRITKNKNTIHDSESNVGRDLTIGDTINYYSFNAIGLQIFFILLIILLISIGIYFFSKSNFTDQISNTNIHTQKGTTNEVEATEVLPVSTIGNHKQNTISKTTPPKEIKTPSSMVNLEKPIDKIKTASDFLTVDQSVDIALFNSNRSELNDFRVKVIAKLKSSQLNFSNNLFRPKFIQTFGNSILDFDIGMLIEYGIDKELACICQIEEHISFEKSEEEGMVMYSAIGDINIHLLNLKTGEINTTSINASGAGMSKPGAKESLEEHLLKSKKLTSIDTQPCK